MPPLYGEGRGAFLRVQLKIMKTSNDKSLFAWNDETIESSVLLAPSLASFRYAINIIAGSPPWIERPPYSMTNKGLEISMNLVSGRNETWIAPLNCVRQYRDSQSTPLQIFLRKSPAVGDGYQRTQCSDLLHLKHTDMTTQPALERIWIKQSQMLSSTRSYCYFRIKSLKLSAPDWEVKKRIILEPELGRWGSPTEDYIPLKLSNTSAAVVLHRVGMLMFMLKVSCVGKFAYATLLRVQLYGDNYLDVDVMGHLRDSKTLNDDNIITNEVKTLRKSVFNMSNLTASTRKEGGSGGREIITILLEDVKATQTEESK